MRKILLIIILLFAFDCLAQNPNFHNEQTINYINKLKAQAKSGKMMFGIANGLDKSYKDPFGKEQKADCENIIGMLPAFVENDFLFLDDDIEFRNKELEKMKSAYQKGVTLGFCWHIKGMNSKSFYKTKEDDSLAKRIVNDENSAERKWFLEQIDTKIVPVFKELEFPIFFRPFHEMNGHWFWWGSKNISPKEYVILYRIIVDRIRENGCKNVIFTFSPDYFLKEEYYPGDDYVDLVGLDVYEPNCSPYHKNGIFLKEISKLVKFGNNHNKLIALTEVGLRVYKEKWRYPEEIPNFWSKYVVEPLKNNNILYFMSWYNSDWGLNDKGSLYYPYPGIEKRFGKKGQEALDDFINISKDNDIIFIKNN